MKRAVLCGLLVRGGCATATVGGATEDLRLELRPAETEWDSEARSEFTVGDDVVLRVTLPIEHFGTESVTVGQYHVRIQGPPGNDQSRPTPTNQTINLDPPSVFRANDLPLIRWRFTVSDQMAHDGGRFTVLVTIPELGLRGSTRLTVSP